MATKRVVKRSADADKVTLFEAFEDFIQEKNAQSLSASTLRNYRQSFEFLCQNSGYNDKTLTEEVDQKAIFSFINNMKLKNVQPSSINHYLRDVRTFLYWCMDSTRAYISPAFKVKEIEKQEEQLKLFTDEELNALLEKPTRREDYPAWRTWAIVNWVLATGNRASTICEVKIGDINFAQKEITLRHTKNKKAQIIPLSGSLETCIKEYIRVWRKDALPSDWLFANYGNEQLTTNALRLSFGRYCKKREVEKTNIHGLRHNFAKLWVKNNGNIFILQKILGHSSLAMTRRYVKLFSEDIKEDYDKYSPLDTLKRSAKRAKKVERT